LIKKDEIQCDSILSNDQALPARSQWKMDNNSLYSKAERK